MRVLIRKIHAVVLKPGRIRDAVAIHRREIFASGAMHMQLHWHGLGAAVLDRAASPGRTLDGVPVLAPHDPEALAQRTLPVVLSVFNRDADAPAIAASLGALGYEAVVPFVAFHGAHAAHLATRFWLTRRDVWTTHAGDLAEAAAHFTDARSREAFDALVALRTEARYTPALRPDAGPQYLDPSVRGWVPAEVACLVDGGAYDGDTLANFAASGVRVRSAHAFEPDPVNHAALARRAKALHDASGVAVTVWPCGLGAGASQVRFDASGGEASHASAQGGTVIQCVGLDEALHGHPVDFVKLDVEGAELDALRGMEGLLRARRPRLALSLYHRPEDLWELPRFVAGLGVGYRMALRLHGHDGFDAVLYAQAG